ncbi:MAG TPA: IPT/TIG domain-containing protein [Nitrospira sp.]
MQAWRTSIYFVVGLAAFTLGAHMPVSAEDATGKGAVVEGTGFTMFDTESTKGFDANKVDRDPICDRSKRPRILKVEPDEAKPGQKVVIKGENFGTKECFHGVAFMAAGSSKIDYTFVNDTTIEATVPAVKAGMTFIDVVAGGGNARSKGFLVHAK